MEHSIDYIPNKGLVLTDKKTILHGIAGMRRKCVFDFFSKGLLRETTRV